MVLLFVYQNSPRLHYVLDEVFSRRLDQSISITHDFDEFLAFTASKKIAYTPIPVDGSAVDNIIWIHQSEMLFESFVRPFPSEPCVQTFRIISSRTKPHLPFEHVLGLFADQSIQRADPGKSHKEIDVSHISLDDQRIPFDLFSALFWCLTRYEEVQWGMVAGLDGVEAISAGERFLSADQHGRYPAEQSLFYRMGCLATPVVDQWVRLLGHCLGSKPNRDFGIVPTADIDMALRFGGRSWTIQAASFLRDLIKTPGLVWDRMAVLFGQKDPYAIDQATLQILTQSIAGSEISPKLFLLGSTERSKRNKQIQKRALANEINRLKSALLQQSTLMGIHPSWQEKNNAVKTVTAWRSELEEFERLLGFTPQHARLHYIHLHLPHSYQLLTQLGIKNDWSMGYPDAVGFRAGTSVPFYWYDLTQEKATDLRVIPFCIMDVTCKNYLKLSNEQSITLGQQLKQDIELLGGTFCFIFHNESVSNKLPWKGWKETILSWSQPISKQPTDVKFNEPI